MEYKIYLKSQKDKPIFIRSFQTHADAIEFTKNTNYFIQYSSPPPIIPKKDKHAGD